MIRPAKPQDIPAIVELAAESVSQHAWPDSLIIDRKAMEEEARSALNPAHFLWVSEIDGEIVAAMGAMVHPSFWFRGKCCSVMLYYTRVSGECLKLLREFARWFKGRSGIKMVIFEAEIDTDPRLLQFMKRIGFRRESTNLVYVRQA